MKLRSTRNKNNIVELKEAVLKSMPEDNGLYVPVSLDPLSKDLISGIKKISCEEINRMVIRHLLKGSVDEKILDRITGEAINFLAPVVEIEKDVYSLELFHGPTLAFKDFGARFMARLMAYFMRNEDRELNILVATSGDTGGAVANGFHNVDGIRVTILYPGGKVSPLQEKQLTTLGGNIRAFEIDGSFDDCQALVKKAFVDKELNEKLLISSANSINIARLIPQTLYYFQAYAQLPREDRNVFISVPSGNFGNLTGGLIAKRLGLDVQRFIAVTNSNDTFPKYLKSGKFKPIKSVSTISNAMDVGDPSNFQRIQYLYNNDINEMRNDIYSRSYSDDETRHAIKEVYEKENYILDPHGAVGYLGLKDFLKANNDQPYYGVFLETAHPSKFIEVVEEVIGEKIEIPERLSILASKRKEAKLQRNDYENFREELLG